MIGETLQAFVMMPFNDNTNAVREAIRVALDQANFDAILVDETYTTSKLTDQIEELIRQSHLCVCDVSGRNPNVAWEYGYATALGKNTILLVQDIEDLYFDIQNNATITYNVNELNKLTQKIKITANKIRGRLSFTPTDHVISGQYDMCFVPTASSVSKTPYDCFSLIAQAKSHIRLAGQNHGFISQSEENRSRFKTELKSLFDRSPKSRFEIMMCDENCAHAVKTWENILETKEYKRHLTESVEYFQELVDYFDTQDIYKGRFVVKKYDFVPLSIMFVDYSIEKRGIAVVTPNGFQRMNISKPCFVLSQRENEKIFDSYWEQYQHIFTAMPSVRLKSKQAY